MSDTLKNQLARFQIANPHSPIGTKGFVNNAFHSITKYRNTPWLTTALKRKFFKGIEIRLRG